MESIHTHIHQQQLIAIIATKEKSMSENKNEKSNKI